MLPYPTFAGSDGRSEVLGPAASGAPSELLMGSNSVMPTAELAETVDEELAGSPVCGTRLAGAAMLLV
jgi:hypothetical protein